jgi:hypothetical protein
MACQVLDTIANRRQTILIRLVTTTDPTDNVTVERHEALGFAL